MLDLTKPLAELEKKWRKTAVLNAAFGMCADELATVRAQVEREVAAEIAKLTGERDRQYEFNIEQIAKQAELEAELSKLRSQLEHLANENHRLKLNLVAPAIQDRLDRQDAEILKLRAELELKTTSKGSVCPNCLQALPEKRDEPTKSQA